MIKPNTLSGRLLGECQVKLSIIYYLKIDYNVPLLIPKLPNRSNRRKNNLKNTYVPRKRAESRIAETGYSRLLF